MIKEAYVSFEVAKLLKEKGFNELCFRLIREDGEYIEKPSQAWNGLTKKQRAEWYIQPTHQMAMAWLRGKGFEVIVIPVWQTLSKVYRSYVLSDLGNKYKDFPDSYSDNITYEEAVEAALKYALENLI